MNSLKFDPKGWQAAYLEEKNNLLYLLSRYDVKIEQIGATSIPSGRSDRNVDILVVAKSIPDMSSIAFKLQNSNYKVLDYLVTSESSALVKKTKVKGYGVTIRVVVNASKVHNRINAFQIYLKEEYSHIKKYNDFREELNKKFPNDWKSYYRRKRDYINATIDENFKFE